METTTATTVVRRGRPRKDTEAAIKVELDKETSKPKLQELIEIGIPLKMITLHRAVRSYKGEPETAFYAYSERSKPSRSANMWFTPHCVVVEQAGNYKLIPNANVSDTIVL